MDSTGSVRLKPGRDKSILHHHPWVYSGAIDRIDGRPEPGDTVEILAAGGRWLARGSYSPRSQIAIRLLTWRQDEPVGQQLICDRLIRAIDLRKSLGLAQRSSAYRMVNAESDLLPGLVVDRYNGFLVLQALSAGAERWKSTVVEVLDDLLHPEGIFERSDVEVRSKEGLDKAAGVLRGSPPPPLLEIEEHGLRFLVDVAAGHKTGMYLDQRENRRRAADWCAGKSVLNAFSFTGGFGVHAGVAGAAQVVHLDSSADALSLARRNVELNHAGESCEHEYLEGNAFSLLRGFRAAGRSFDVIILDPPKFAENAGQLARALNGYKDINLVALQILKPGGTLITFSCSGLVSPAVFQQVVWEAALDAGRDACIIERLTQAPDHPVLLHFPEGEYLKGLVIRA